MCGRAEERRALSKSLLEMHIVVRNGGPVSPLETTNPVRALVPRAASEAGVRKH